MPFLVITSWYPTHKASEVIKIFPEILKKYPPSVLAELGETSVNQAVTTTEKGLKAMSFYDVKKGKLEEALMTAKSALAMAQSIEGYEYTIEVWSTITEAFETLGMQAPT